MILLAKNVAVPPATALYTAVKVVVPLLSVTTYTALAAMFRLALEKDLSPTASESDSATLVAPVALKLIRQPSLEVLFEQVVVRITNAV